MGKLKSLFEAQDARMRYLKDNNELLGVSRVAHTDFTFMLELKSNPRNGEISIREELFRRAIKICTVLEDCKVVGDVTDFIRSKFYGFIDDLFIDPRDFRVNCAYIGDNTIAAKVRMTRNGKLALNIKYGLTRDPFTLYLLEPDYKILAESFARVLLGGPTVQSAALSMLGMACNASSTCITNSRLRRSIRELLKEMDTVRCAVSFNSEDLEYYIPYTSLLVECNKFCDSLQMENDENVYVGINMFRCMALMDDDRPDFYDHVRVLIDAYEYLNEELILGHLFNNAGNTAYRTYTFNPNWEIRYIGKEDHVQVSCYNDTTHDNFTFSIGKSGKLTYIPALVLRYLVYQLTSDYEVQRIIAFRSLSYLYQNAEDYKEIFAALPTNAVFKYMRENDIAYRARDEVTESNYWCGKYYNRLCYDLNDMDKMLKVLFGEEEHGLLQR